MSDASRLVTSPLLRQNALHHEVTFFKFINSTLSFSHTISLFFAKNWSFLQSGDSRDEGDSAFAEITVADEIEARSEAVRLVR